jgi:hypothetical protein
MIQRFTLRPERVFQADRQGVKYMNGGKYHVQEKGDL